MNLDVKIENSNERWQNISINKCFQSIKEEIDTWKPASTSQNFQIITNDDSNNVDLESLTYSDFILGIDSKGTPVYLGTVSKNGIDLLPTTYRFGNMSTFNATTTNGTETITQGDDDIYTAALILKNPYTETSEICEGNVTYEVDDTLYNNLLNKNFSSITLGSDNMITVNCNGTTTDSFIEDVYLERITITYYYWDTPTTSTSSAGMNYTEINDNTWSPQLTFSQLNTGTQYGPFETKKLYLEWYNEISKEDLEYPIRVDAPCIEQFSQTGSLYSYNKHEINKTVYKLSIVKTANEEASTKYYKVLA